MDEEWKRILLDLQEKIKTIGFFATIGKDFAESTPLLSEDVKNAPWERLSSTDQCFKMIQELAVKAWRNVEGIAAFVEPNGGADRDLIRKIIEPDESKIATETPPYIQTIIREIRHLKTMGETIISLAGDGKHVSELDHSRVKSMGEMIISTAKTINENFRQQREKINNENSGGEEMESQEEKPLVSIAEEMNYIKAFGSSLMAMGMAFHDGFRINPRQVETLGRMIVDLADKVLNQTGTLPLPLPPA